ncbi:acetoin utilization protein AcuC [Ornithinimicrobium ciconiae]|uniref:Acetoin utilization protein AcuC n=1 Tax=Ornithinimicrobium ciconiae TaxID=2594265 RepID=A0A516GED1_9MICO|nr:acetoin utilization protein AcuC [Ornithinimicrobium ciconiae]QDO89865.1 acetoin utilization protein AcuC [Ornithinimicrobium ciconiae]
MIGARVVWDQRFTSYDFGPGHPMHPSRLELTHRLCDELGLLSLPQVTVVGAEEATDDQIRTVHTAALVEAVRAVSEDPRADVTGHGLGMDDTPSFAGMHDATALAVGATIDSCRAVWTGEASHAVNIAGGLHHGMPDSVAGFCVYNDIAVGIQWLLDQGVERVAYVDVDVHHGDGVERAFWDDPRVMTVSVHETGAALFPGTGFPGDTGGPRAPDSAVNVALPPGTGDEGWLRAIHSVVPQVVRAFRPQILVTQHGCDAHYADPLSHLTVSIDAMEAAYRLVHDLAHELTGGKWVALGGGGYELVEVVPRAWTHLVAIAAHQPVSLTLDTPQPWRDYVAEHYGRDAPLRMGDLDGREIRYGTWESGYEPERPVDAAIMATRRAVFPGWGLDPWFD